MDSLSQLALGAAVGVAVMGRRTAVWKAALWGGICGTLPDLDAFIDHGDAIRNMTFHRAESHSLFYLTLAAPVVAAVAAGLHGELKQFRRWWLALWLVLFTHPLLDLMTVYGTQLLQPFDDFPYAVGSLFIIDPLYTLPLLFGLAGSLLVARRSGGMDGHRWNAWGLALSTAYVGWSVLAQQLATQAVQASVRAQGLPVERLLVTPTPFNTVLWRVVAITPDGYSEGFRSLLDGNRPLKLDPFPRGEALFAQRRGDWHAERMAWFSHGFYKMYDCEGRDCITDLRMGQEPNYTFTFALPRRNTAATAGQALPEQLPMMRPDIGRTLPWLWQRMWGAQLPPPR